MKTKFISLLLLAATVVSCDELGGGKGEALTPDESKVKLEEVAQEAIALANPNKQKELLDIIDEFYLIAEDLELNYDDAAVEAAYAILQPVKQICGNKTKAVMQLASVHETYYIGAEGAFGIYTHDGASWTFTESDEKIEFSFEVGGDPVVMTIKPSGETYKYEHTSSWTDIYWNGSEYETTEGSDTYKINVPGKVEASLTKGKKTLFDLTINGQYKLGGDPINVAVDLVMGAYDLDFKADVTTAKIGYDLTFKVDGQTLRATSVAANGEFNLDPDYYYDIDDFTYYTDIVKLKSVSATTQILDLKLSASCSDVIDAEKDFWALMEKVDTEEENWDGNGTPYSLDKAHVGKVCSFFNNKIKNEASYSNGAAFAKVQLKAQYYDYETWHHGYQVQGYYEPMVILEFEDGSKFSIEEYFNEDDFADVVDDFNNLLTLYENCLPNIMQ